MRLALLAGVFILSFAAAPAEAQTTCNYAGQLDGQSIHVTIIWENYSGLGPIRGHLAIDGVLHHFIGSNDSQGHIWFVYCTGDEFVLHKSLRDGRIVWTGTLNGCVPVSFSRRT